MHLNFTDLILQEGYALFDLVQIRNGKILHIDQHLDRLFRDLPTTYMNDFPYSREEVEQILNDLVKESGCSDASCRMFAAGALGSDKPRFYACVEDGIPSKPLSGIKEL